MPNWCYNKIEIHGSEEERNKFHRFLNAEIETRNSDEADSDLSPLLSFVPMPEYYKTQAGFNDGGYDWCVRNWGTKWSEHGLIVESSRDCDTISFDTAWSPPIEGYKHISSFFDDLTFCHIWSELGMCVAGFSVYRRGMTITLQDIDERFLPSFDGDMDSFEEGLFDFHITLSNQARCFIPRVATIGE